ncbi:Trehalose synthase [Minicystis rosea]|nr:Trehalose synthase [Minicystis rosea]
MRGAESGKASAPDWYKDAIVYELRVRSFYDGNGDGIGDFPGLLAKLDYLQDLGVTAIWLLPFYPSPLRDDGYDISDYTDVHPECGTLADFDRFIEEAHRRGLKIITELVLNHTSDQHPWFQRARRAPPGSPERERYVWSDTPDRYREARIIFKDFEPSNWSWDPLARAYFWHRFYAHQPDLNFDNPEVRETMLGIVDFWLERGVDGLRLDAVPYLFEREGTSCENLEETHGYLRALRAHVDTRYADRMLLAEANQWPEDAVAYFGRGDECHMAFHFPIMPRIFMAIHGEDRFPIVDVLAQTPEIPETSQWALFLRNHDELTLEMVTDEERDAMYRAYAAEPVMRLNLGIRRRLAPLAGNDRRQIELMNALLFSLPGTPVVYYGDEIGMGDNVFLGDRNGVRTPMQWSADKNAGFSRANPQRLVLPIIIDPEYHFEAINVEAQQQTPSSLAWWMKRLIALRKRFRAFGRGSIELLAPENPRIFAFVRRYDSETVLMVANLSRLVQFVDLDLAAFQGLVPIELFGRSELPAIGTARYPLTLAGHGFYLLSLERPVVAHDLAHRWSPPLLEVMGSWESALAPEHDGVLARVLSAFAAAHTWYGGRGRRVEGARIVDAVPVGEPVLGFAVIVEVAYEGGEKDRYVVPITHATGARAAEIQARAPGAVVARLRSPSAKEGEDEILFEATAEPLLSRAMLEATLSRGRFRGRAGALLATMGHELAERIREPASLSEERAPETGRTTVAFGERFFLHAPRRLDDGPSPGLEMSRALTARGAGVRVPPLAATIEYQAGRRDPVTIAVLRGFVPGEADGRVHAQDELTRYYERVLARDRDAPPPAPRGFHPLRLVGEEPASAPAREAVGAYLDTASLVGRRTAELHLALAGITDDPAFAPEPYSPFDQRGTYQAVRTLARRCHRELQARLRDFDPETRVLAERVLAGEPRVLARLGALLGRRLTAQRTRHHGTFDIGKTLYTSNDVVIADLDGDGARPWSERRRKASPLRDVASLIRSLHEVAFTTLQDETRVRLEDRDTARPWADLWWWSSSAVLLGAYLATAREGTFLPSDREELGLLLDAFFLEAGFNALAAALAEGGNVKAALAFLARLLDEG